MEKFTKVFMIILAIMACLYLFKITFAYIYPFFIAVFITVLLHPIVSYVEQRTKLSRSLSIFLLLGSFSVLFFVGLLLFASRLVTGLLSLTQHVGDIKPTILEIGHAFYNQITQYFPFIRDWSIKEQLDTMIDSGSSMLIDFLTDILSTSAHTISTLSNFILMIIFIFLAVYMLTKDYHFLKEKVMTVVPHKFIHHFSPVITYTKKAFLGLIRAQFLLTSISTIIIAICLYFFQLDHFLTLAVIIFFVDFIPYVGIGIIFMPWILFLFITGDYVLTIQLASLYAGILFLRQIMEPRLIAKEIGVHPFIALSILFLGYQTMGLLGILLTPFMLILISAFYKAHMFRAIYDYIQKK